MNNLNHPGKSKKLLALENQPSFNAHSIQRPILMRCSIQVTTMAYCNCSGEKINKNVHRIAPLTAVDHRLLSRGKDGRNF